MAVFQLYEVPYPNFAAEAAAAADQPSPVEPAAAAQPVRPVESILTRSPDTPDPRDLLSLSRRVREAASGAAARRALAEKLPAAAVTRQDIASNAGGIRNNQSVRQLMESFLNYDNSEAVSEYLARIGLQSRYGPENTLGITEANSSTRQVREGLSSAIDRWFVGEGVFFPEMLQYTSSDGFRFTPLRESSRSALRLAAVMAEEDAARTAAYRRETARLTPQDFLFYDLTGLGSLQLEERRELLRRIERLLEERQIEALAGELRYRLAEAERLEIITEDIEDEVQRRRLDEIAEEVSGYYGFLRASVRQYGPGIISSAFR